MITDAIIKWWQQILSFLVNLIPDAPIIAAGNGASSGTACCAAFMINGLTALFSTAVTTASGSVPLVASITNNPIVVVIDWSTLGFAVGCLISFLAAFLILKIFMVLWAQVKW